MTIREKKDRMAWFKMDAGSFIADTTGLGNKEVGVYAKLMMLYWVSGNKLPEHSALLKRKIGITSSEEDEALLQAILHEFFPPNADGDHHHEQLDDQLDAIRGYSKMQSDKAKKRYLPQSTYNEDDTDADF